MVIDTLGNGLFRMSLYYLPGDVAVRRAGPAAVGGGLPAPGAALALAAVALVAALPAAVVGVAPVIVLVVVVEIAGHLRWKIWHGNGFMTSMTFDLTSS